MNDSIFKDMVRKLPCKEKEEVGLIGISYQHDLNEAKSQLADYFSKLKNELHPRFLYSGGDSQVLTDLNYLIENKKTFLGVQEKGSWDEKEKEYDKENESGGWDVIRNQSSTVTVYRDVLNRLSERFSQIFFGEFVNDLYENEILYQSVASSFRKMGVQSHLIGERGPDRKVIVNLSKLDLGTFAYKFVPWSSGLDNTVGKPLQERCDDNGMLHVNIGLKYNVFRSISTGFTVPVHEIIHHISSKYNSGGFSAAILKSFNQSFDKELKRVLNLSEDRGLVFNSIDDKMKKELTSAGLDVSERDLSDPFVFWEIAKRNGFKLSEIVGVDPQKLEKSAHDYLINYLPFRFVEEGVATYLSIENACIDSLPREFAGMENSLKLLVNFGSTLSKFGTLERGIDFYTSNKLHDFSTAESQLYPVAFMYTMYQANKEKEKDVKWFFDLIKNNYASNGIQTRIEKPIKPVRTTGNNAGSSTGRQQTSPVRATYVLEQHPNQTPANQSSISTNVRSVGTIPRANRERRSRIRLSQVVREPNPYTEDLVQAPFTFNTFGYTAGDMIERILAGDFISPATILLSNGIGWLTRSFGNQRSQAGFEDNIRQIVLQTLGQYSQQQIYQPYSQANGENSFLAGAYETVSTDDLTREFNRLADEISSRRRVN